MWRRLCPRAELSFEVTLSCGQSFAWKIMPDKQWIGVIGRNVVALRDCDATDSVLYKLVHPKEVTDLIDARVRDYFRTEVHNSVTHHHHVSSPVCQNNLAQLYDAWKKPNDKHTAAFVALPGLRTLRQDPVECLFSFICSSNNNIARIQQLVDKLRVNYGDKLAAIDDMTWFAFPTVDQLASIDESQLRELGFGYRAQYIVKSAAILSDLGGEEYLLSLRANPDAAHVQTALTQFSGVGRKVADCVALFSLDKLEAIPVDTHVWQISCRDFQFKKAATKSLTPTIYAEVGKLYQNRFQPYAGWAHSILFAADLTKFKAILSPSPGKKKRKTMTRTLPPIPVESPAATEQVHHANGRKMRSSKK
ncbi:hypothetical protein H310_05982 [Aphanomyces invadans]|uniref:DNA-(apurinic or apyrimidinic site) lyase n=1 Tax=Aphanomyces invadans TaxID=157072 RepID=A0A024U7T3_9STRA|nr:hypothetical protein H310_05982 [Aphanomyces invadans]ETW02481.1 hypothetical protein H310_05982 [Aphanomyces invadans]|eukprot:XP_008869086.1 hypothetical protein H310_05982 [Aphanomyces invadans]